MGDFVHLHNHSHYSLQDAACSVSALISTAKKYDMHALALTDHGVMYGVSEFYREAKKAGIKPIIGMEAYIAPFGSRFDKGLHNNVTGKKQRNYFHLVLLAKNKIGYKNLLKLCTIGHTEGFYYRPRIDLEVLKQYKEGLICTTACPAGPISSFLIEGDYEGAKKMAITYRELFGDDFYLEIQDHGLDVEKPILAGMPKLSKELGIKLIATNDIHYIEKEHAIAHNIMLLFSDKNPDTNYRELRYKTDEIYFKTSEQMKALFKNYKGAIENTLEIEEKIDLKLDFEGFQFPVFPIPADSKTTNYDEYFEELAIKGLHKRIANFTPEYEDRLRFEIDTIKTMGFTGYFLIVQDFINAAKAMGIPVGPGRGSAAGSLVAWALGITEVDPLDYDLLFERFLNPSRKSMPDIDVDFADDRRADVIEYVKQKYGENAVSQIIAFNKLSSKAVLKDVARVLKIPIPTVNSINKWIPTKYGKVFTIQQAIDTVPELKWVKNSEEPVIKELIKHAQILENLNRNSSRHAAGVVIAPSDVSNYVPLIRAGEDNMLVTQFDKDELDKAGLLKMDFLGLSTLTIIRNAITYIKENRGIEIDIEKIPLDDKLTFDLFAKGQTTAVFQFESTPMREYLKKLVPTSIKDLSAMNALYRPGPMEYINSFIARKHGKETVEYLHPLLEPILKETYGIIVYQEQVIQIANRVAGMSLADADLLRRAMGKKDTETMLKQKAKFIEESKKNNIPHESAISIFEDIDKFANYGFNKSHAVAYSIVAYQTAYLKAHYLPEFLAANLTRECGKADKVAILLEDCRKLKVKVLPPSINKPSVYFVVEDGIVVFGLSAIKNVGVGAVEEIIRAHEKLGRDFKGIYDFCCNVDTHIVNKRGLEGLVFAGAFDSTVGSRAQNFAAVEDALDYAAKAISSKNDNMFSLFEDDELEITEPELPRIAPWDLKQKLAKEREVLGFYLTSHPLSNFSTEYSSFSAGSLGEPETFTEGSVVNVCGVITDVKTKIDKSNKQMAFFKLDDFSGSCECLTFSKNYESCGSLIVEENTVMVKGRVEASGDGIKLHVEDIYHLHDARFKFTKKVILYLDDTLHDENTIKCIKNIGAKYGGTIPVYVSLRQETTRRDFYSDIRIDICDECINQLLTLLGEDSIRFA
ncbi:MAG: DNA polymerase III subunit alpha [bacterium]